MTLNTYDYDGEDDEDDRDGRDGRDGGDGDGDGEGEGKSYPKGSKGLIPYLGDRSAFDFIDSRGCVTRRQIYQFLSVIFVISLHLEENSDGSIFNTIVVNR